MSRFAERVAIVTAAGSPLGAATALRLAREGAALVLVDRSADAVRATAARFAGGARIETVVGDPREKHTAVAAVHACEKRFGRVDVLVNQVSEGADAPFPDQDLAAWSEIFETIVKGTFHVCREAAKAMIARALPGRIVNVSGVHGMRGETRASNHGAAKAAVEQFTRCLAVELAPHQIAVNAVAVGMVDARERANEPGEAALTEHAFFAPPPPPAATPASGTQRFFAKTMREGRVPLGRAAKPDEIAAAIAFLASSEASYVDGHVLVVDGGLSSAL